MCRHQTGKNANEKKKIYLEKKEMDEGWMRKLPAFSSSLMKMQSQRESKPVNQHIKVIYWDLIQI